MAGGPRAETLALERALYRSQRALIDTLSTTGPPLRDYERRYRGRVRRYEAVVPARELWRAASEADVVYVGDYHTLAASQGAFAELVARAADRPRPLVLALEFLEGRFQDAADAYVRGRIGEETFLARIDYARRFAFPVWVGHRRVFKLARERGLKVLGVDRRSASGEAPAARDAYAASRIARALAAPERPRVLVLAGQLHVAPPHLPRAVGRALAAAGGPAARSVVVYQNCEDVYWRLARRGLWGRVEAVRIRAGEYCLLNASPVLCQQSLLDRAVDLDDGPLFESDLADGFRHMARMVAGLVRADIEAVLDAVEVYTAGDLSFLAAMRARGVFTQRELRGLRRHVLVRESCYVPRARAVYLATRTVGHAAEEAAHFVRHVCAGDGMDQERGLIDGFYARTLEEAIGFFGSKIVAPRRVCLREPDYRRLGRGPDAGLRQVTELVLAHKRLERGGRGPAVRRLYAKVEPDLFQAVTHALGYVLGDDLYRAFVRGRLTRREVRELFRDPFDEDGAAFHTYFYLAQRYGRSP